MGDNMSGLSPRAFWEKHIALDPGFAAHTKHAVTSLDSIASTPEGREVMESQGKGR